MPILVALFLLAQADAKSGPSPAFSADDRTFVGVNFSADGRFLAACGDQFVVLYKVGDFKIARELRLRGLVDEVVFDPQTDLVVCRGKAIDTAIWDVTTWTESRPRVTRPVTNFETRPWLNGLPPAGPDAAPGTLGKLMSNGGNQWNAGRWMRFVENPLGSCPASFSTDGRWLAMSNGGKGIRLWDMKPYWGDRREVLEYPDFAQQGQLEHANALVFHPRYLLLGEEEGFITPLALRTWESLGDTGAPPAEPSVTKERHDAYRRHAGHVTSLSLSADQTMCVSAGLDGKVCVWWMDQLVASQAATPAWTVAGHFAALSPSGRSLAVAEAKGVRIYDFASRSPTGWIPADATAGRVVRLRFDPTGAALAGISCACTECVPRKGDDVSLGAHKPRHQRTHHHGGRLQVWSLAALGARREGTELSEAALKEAAQCDLVRREAKRPPLGRAHPCEARTVTTSDPARVRWAQENGIDLGVSRGAGLPTSATFDHARHAKECPLKELNLHKLAVLARFVKP